MSVVTVCKNVIASNNKRGWKNPAPAIRIGNTSKSMASDHAYEVAILDANGNTVAMIQTTEDGEPIVRCGAKVAITTVYPVKRLK